MIHAVSPQEMRRIDPLSYDLWKKFIRPYVGRSMMRTRDMRQLLESGPSPTCPNPVIKKIIKNGAGMDGFQAAMMTWAYLAAVCRHHENKLRQRTR